MPCLLILQGGDTCLLGQWAPGHQDWTLQALICAVLPVFFFLFASISFCSLTDSTRECLYPDLPPGKGAEKQAPQAGFPVALNKPGVGGIVLFQLAGH